MSSPVLARSKILRAIAIHLEENECNHSLKEILSFESQDKQKGWSVSKGSPTTDGSVNTTQDFEKNAP